MITALAVAAALAAGIGTSDAAMATKLHADRVNISAELALDPWLCARIGLQYVMCQRFSGASQSCDVASNGRSAQDNNTLLPDTWFAF
jgi:hypothetical protein